MVRFALRAAGVAAVVGAACITAAWGQAFRVDRCIDGRCKNGRIHSVAVTDEHFIVIVDPNACNGRGYCPSRYARIVVEDDTPLRIDGYEPGTASNDSFTVYVPRRYTTLYLYGINGPDRSAAIDLRQYEVRAADGGAAATPPAPRPAQAAARAAAGTTGGVAVILGIERYRHAPAARFAAADARAVRDRLVTGLGLSEADVLLRLDGEATAGEWAMALDPRGWLASRTGGASDVLVYFAGRGVDDRAGAGPVLLPHDVDPAAPWAGRPLGALLEDLAALGASTVTVVLETAFPAPVAEAAVRDPLAGLAVPEGIVVFVAAGAAETNGTLDSRRQGRFTWHWLEGLSGGADADGDGRVTAGEMLSWVERAIASGPGNGVEQHPRLLGNPSAVLPFAGALR